MRGVATLKETAAYTRRQHKNSIIYNAGGKQEADLFVLILQHVGGLLQK